MRRDPHTGAPDFFQFARDYLHAYMPKTRGLSPKTIEAYRISLECFLDYLAEAEHIGREHVSFDHFDRQHQGLPLAKLVLGPIEHGAERLRDYLAANLYTPVESIDLLSLLDVSNVPVLMSLRAQQDMFLTIGAALRHEEAVL